MEAANAMVADATIKMQQYLEKIRKPALNKNIKDAGKAAAQGTGFGIKQLQSRIF
jgi:hypothetical protein